MTSLRLAKDLHLNTDEVILSWSHLDNLSCDVFAACSLLSVEVIERSASLRHVQTMTNSLLRVK